MVETVFAPPPFFISKNYLRMELKDTIADKNVCCREKNSFKRNWPVDSVAVVPVDGSEVVREVVGAVLVVDVDLVDDAFVVSIVVSVDGPITASA